ncbi:hypothetical protein [Streptomyces chattanoogensis]|uniref:Uncharacterized protein n=1 Tax=Streptomyces chattanoogensis TaxID=66876 RepID=A0A0N1JWN7_9ACTN|nr:hypothetical protein [Streptomyces chattanoogensis]KPC61167.1 hypothetical protein ADL29_25650 [Streptomyces chattanoogensis]
MSTEDETAAAASEAGPEAAKEAGAAAGDEPPEPGDAWEDAIADFLDASLASLPQDRSVQFVHAPQAAINMGALSGGQHVGNHGGPGEQAGRRLESHEGPVSAQEILEAGAGFAEPACFGAALGELTSRILFLSGEPGTGRRTTALNLLRRHNNNGMALRALDSDLDLSRWSPRRGDARGCLLEGVPDRRFLKAGVIASLRNRLRDADACLLIVLPDDPELVRDLERDLHLTVVRYSPPPPHDVFAARLADAVPDAATRSRLLAGLETDLLDELLAPQLVPVQVAELVTAITSAEDGGTDAGDLRDRLSFLAGKEVPDLLKKLLNDPDGLAFLLATCVFEGLDRRIVRDQAQRLLARADGRLDAVLVPRDGEGPGQAQQPRPNPDFVFRRSMDDLLRTVRAECSPREIRATSGHDYAVEPVRFTRHRQAEAVLRYVWREFGQLPELLTDWLEGVGLDDELTGAVGRVMGMAASWGGGRSALAHIQALATSDHTTSRKLAVHALGVAAEDPVLASEVKYRLDRWSRAQGWKLRWTVAHACGTDFGAARPERALRLLSRLARELDDKRDAKVDRVMRLALVNLFVGGSQTAVFRRLADWSEADGTEAGLAFRTLPALFRSGAEWFAEQLITEGEFAARTVDLIRRTLNDEEYFGATAGAVHSWCTAALWDDNYHAAVEILLFALAEDLVQPDRPATGVLRLFAVLAQDESPALPGKRFADEALEAWRSGRAPRSTTAHHHRRMP